MADDVKKVQVAIEATSNLPETAKSAKSGLHEVGKGAEEAKEGMHLFNEEGTEMRKLANELDRVLPGLGEAFRVLRHPMAGSLVAGIGVFVEVKRYIDEVNKALDEMAKRGAEADFLPNIEARRDGLASLAQSAQSYVDKLGLIATGQQSLNDKLKAELDLDKAIEVARAQLQSAQKALDLATINRDEAAGRLSPEAAAERRAQVEKKFFEQEQKDREAAQDKEIASKEKQLKNDQDDAKKIAQARAEAEAQVAKEESHRKFVTVDPEKQLGAIRDAFKEIEEAEKNLARVKFQNLGQGLPGSAAFERQQEADANLERAQAHMRSLQRQLVQSDEANSPQALAQAQKDKDAAEEARKKQTENIAQQAQLINEIRQLREVIAATRGIERQTTGVKEQTADVDEATRITKTFERDAHFLNTFDKTQHLTPELISEAAKTVRDMQEILEKHADLLQALADLKPAIDNLRKAQAIIDSQNQGGAQNTFSQ